MKVALIADPLWLMQELTTLRRLVVGLVDEQVRVVRVTPQWLEHRDEGQAMTSQQITYGGSRWPWLRDLQVRRLAGQLREMEVDVLHVLDATLASAGAKLAGAMDLPLVVSVWSSGELAGMKPIAVGRSAAAAGSGEAGDEAGSGTTATTATGEARAYLAATPALADAVRQRAGEGADVRLVPPGVYSTAEAGRGPLADPASALSCIVVGNGRPDEHYMSLLKGMAQVREQLPQAMYFFYTVATDQHRIWQVAEKLGLLSQVTVVTFDPASRELLVQADVVIQPQPLGAARSLVLEAMAAGRPVLGSADEVLDYMIDGRTARVLTEPSADDWAAALTSLTQQPQQYIDLGASAREYVREHHSVSGFVSETLKAYRAVAMPENIPFEQ